MSAPLVVNTVEGTVWTRRPVTRDGVVLYAPAAIDECPEFVMATYAELEKHGIAGTAEALPVPVGSEPQAESLPLKVVAELNDLRMRLAGMANPPREVYLALYEGAEPELFTSAEAARECCDDLAKTDAGENYWDWTVNEAGIHVQFWTHPDDDRPLSETSGTVTPIVVQGDDDLAADGAKTEPLIVDADGAEPTPLRWGLNDVMWGDDDTVTVLLSDSDGQPFWLELEPSQAAVLRDDLAGPDGPAVFRAAWDTEQCGPLYGREEAARAHCLHDARIDYPDGTPLAWRVFTDDCAELFAVVGGKEGPTGYTVTRLPLASEYEEEADE